MWLSLTLHWTLTLTLHKMNVKKHNNRSGLSGHLVESVVELYSCAGIVRDVARVGGAVATDWLRGGSGGAVRQSGPSAALNSIIYSPREPRAGGRSWSVCGAGVTPSRCCYRTYGRCYKWLLWATGTGRRPPLRTPRWRRTSAATTTTTPS